MKKPAQIHIFWDNISSPLPKAGTTFVVKKVWERELEVLLVQQKSVDDLIDEVLDRVHRDMAKATGRKLKKLQTAARKISRVRGRK